MTSMRFSLERCPRSRAAFTLLELLVIVAVVAVLAAVLLPAPVCGKGKAVLTHCLSNQKQITLGMIVWAIDHEKERFPFRLGWWEGGSSPGPADRFGPVPQGAPLGWAGQQASQSWFQFAWVSNEVLNPKVLVCPADKNVRLAENFTAGPQGLANPSFQNRAISYALALDPAAAAPGSFVLLADRNLDPGTLSDDVGASRCSSGLRANATVRTPAATGWWDQPSFGHRKLGGVATADGAVRPATQSDLRQILGDALKVSRDNGLLHFLLPERN